MHLDDDTLHLDDDTLDELEFLAPHIYSEIDGDQPFDIPARLDLCRRIAQYATELLDPLADAVITLDSDYGDIDPASRIEHAHRLLHLIDEITKPR